MSDISEIETPTAPPSLEMQEADSSSTESSETMMAEQKGPEALRQAALGTQAGVVQRQVHK